MRSIPLMLVLGIVLASCKYQYFSYNSALDKNIDDQSFDYQNSILVNYEFTSTGDMIINLKNRGKKDVYLDLTKSKVIVNNDTITLFEDDSLRGPRVLADMNALAIIYSNKEKKIRFHSLGNSFEKLKNQEFKPFRIGNRKARKYTFHKENSVKKFTSQLVIFTDNEQEKQVFKHNFWVDEIVQSRLNKDFPLPNNEIKAEAMTVSSEILLGMVSAPLFLFIIYLECEECHN